VRTLVKTITSATVGYLIGTLPSADVVSRLASGGEVNIRDAGTGNPGAANVADVIGKKWGAVVLGADVAKGFVGARVGGQLGGHGGRYIGGPAAVLGHCFPVWENFNGGKGVATSGGQVLATQPCYFPIDVAVISLASRLPVFKRRAFAATELASATWVVLSTLWWRRRWPNPGAVEPSIGLPLAAIATSAIIRYRFLRTNEEVDRWRAEQANQPEG
jgi:glycerol-3-phosphate acyltransferase PlsY